MGLSGDMQRIRCRLSRTQSMKYCFMLSCTPHHHDHHTDPAADQHMLSLEAGSPYDTKSACCTSSLRRPVCVLHEPTCVSSMPGLSLRKALRRSAVMAMYSSFRNRPGTYGAIYIASMDTHVSDLSPARQREGGQGVLTSPVMRMELMSSRKTSSLISDSVNRNAVCLRCWPVTHPPPHSPPCTGRQRPDIRRC